MSDFLDDLDDVDYAPAPAVGILLSDVAPERVEWLWYGRVPLGKLSVLDGDPGLGKSTLTLELAARVSRGAPLPGDSLHTEPCGVVLLSAEDDLADTIRPRLDAAGADVSRILALRTVPDGDDELPPSIPDDLHHVADAIARVNARLLIIDPVMAFLGGGIDAHRDQDVRRALHRLSVLAEDTGCAVVIVRHLNKTAASNPLYRGGGSIGIVGAARSGLLVARDPDDESRRVLASTKCNLAPEPPSLAWHIESTETASRIVWDGECVHGAAALLAAPVDEHERTARDDARDFISGILADGPISAKEIERQARGAGISKRTLDRAKSELHVESVKNYAGWSWRLPKDARQSDDGTLALLAPLEESAGQSTDKCATPEKVAKDARVPVCTESASLPLPEHDADKEVCR